MREGQSTAVRRENYTAPAFWIDTVDLTFDLDPAKTRVLNKMRLRRNPDVTAQPLRLDGEDLTLVSLHINDEAWSDYKEENNQLVIDNLPMALIFDLSFIQTAVGSFLMHQWGMLIHSNLMIRFGPLTPIFVGPQVHRIHHSIKPEHQNKNFGQFFPIRIS